MPNIRDYPQAFTLENTDAFVMDRIGVGTLFIEGDDIGGGGGGAVTVPMVAAEAIFAGAFVNIFSNSGTLSMRLADATNATKYATGFCLAAVPIGNLGLVSFPGALNTSVTVSVIEPQTWLSVTVPGGYQITPPSVQGQFIQTLGPAMTGGFGINFQPGLVIGL